jgi:HD-GYP domain-containing protein (c-di-GMP phosphodiesterase class II)/DNA-binding CsgD family transcriptional regulator
MPERLADLLTGLSLVADLGFGLEPGTAQRSGVLAAQLARSLGASVDDVRAAYYTALLHHIGCLGYAHETARLFADELVVNRAAGRTDSGSVRDVAFTFIPMLSEGRPLLTRLRLVATTVTRGAEWGREFTATACELGRDTARRLGLSVEVQDSLFHVYDEWGARSPPPRLSGEDIPVGARVARLAAVAVLFEQTGGIDLALEAVRRRSGGMLDPELVAFFVGGGGRWLQEVGSDDVLAVEPHPWVLVSDLLPVAKVFGDLADLKSPLLTGHSRSVAALASGAARSLRLDGTVVADLEVAGYLHDVGRVGVSSSVWGKTSSLTAGERELVRLHAYHSERILARSAGLARLAGLVGRHHEHLDGSGYPRGCTERDLPTPARVLAAADALATLTERRAGRAALPQADADARLLELTDDGKLDPDAVRAVLATAGHDVTVPGRPLPAGLSTREAEVLGLVAQGLSNAEIAKRLVISPRTAEHHVQHIYGKVGVSSRAAATLFAAEHDLLGRDG